MTKPAAAPKTPKNTDAAIAMFDRFAQLDAQLAAINANRNKAIADTNAVADNLAAPIAAELTALRAPLKAWWDAAGVKLLEKDRKSIELGGCMIGTRLGNKVLAYAHGDDKAALAALTELRWAKPYIRVTYGVDKVALKKALTGRHGAGLAELGFAERQPETFFLERVAQAGTMTGNAGA